MENVDLIIQQAMIVTMDKDLRILDDHTLIVDGGRIKAVEPAGQALERYSGRQVIDGRDQFVFPGFINTHTHLFQSSLKGLGRDKTLYEWLDSSVRRALPYMAYENVYHAALAGCIENIHSGVTTVLDYMYAHCSQLGLDDAVIQAFDETGIRGILGRAHTKTASLPAGTICAVDETEEMFFYDVDRLVEKTRGHERISLAIAPGIIWDMGEEGYQQLRRTADRHGIPITMHLDETRDDDEYALQRYGISAAEVLDRNGVLGEDFIGVHLVHLSEQTMDLLVKRRIKVSHNPVSNMILASGVSPIGEMKSLGLDISLATDGAASNDSQNMLEVIKIAAIIHKCFHQDAALLPAIEILKMATCDGAKVIGRADELGSIEVGKRADFFLFDPRNIASVPVADPVSSLVYSSNPTAIRTVVIQGRVVMDKGQICTLDEETVIRSLQKSAFELRQRAGLGNEINGRKVIVGPFST